jgi:hypothetical protein
MPDVSGDPVTIGGAARPTKADLKNVTGPSYHGQAQVTGYAANKITLSNGVTVNFVVDPTTQKGSVIIKSSVAELKFDFKEEHNKDQDTRAAVFDLLRKQFNIKREFTVPECNTFTKILNEKCESKVIESNAVLDKPREVPAAELGSTLGMILDNQYNFKVIPVVPKQWDNIRVTHRQDGVFISLICSDHAGGLNQDSQSGSVSFKLGDIILTPEQISAKVAKIYKLAKEENIPTNAKPPGSNLLAASKLVPDLIKDSDIKLTTIVNMNIAKVNFINVNLDGVYIESCRIYDSYFAGTANKTVFQDCRSIKSHFYFHESSGLSAASTSFDFASSIRGKLENARIGKCQANLLGVESLKGTRFISKDPYEENRGIKFLRSKLDDSLNKEFIEKGRVRKLEEEEIKSWQKNTVVRGIDFVTRLIACPFLEKPKDAFNRDTLEKVAKSEIAGKKQADIDEIVKQRMLNKAANEVINELVQAKNILVPTTGHLELYKEGKLAGELHIAILAEAEERLIFDKLAEKPDDHTMISKQNMLLVPEGIIAQAIKRDKNAAGNAIKTEIVVVDDDGKDTAEKITSDYLYEIPKEKIIAAQVPEMIEHIYKLCFGDGNTVAVKTSDAVTVGAIEKDKKDEEARKAAEAAAKQAANQPPTAAPAAKPQPATAAPAQPASAAPVAAPQQPEPAKAAPEPAAQPTSAPAPEPQPAPTLAAEQQTQGSAADEAQQPDAAPEAVPQPESTASAAGGDLATQSPSEPPAGNTGSTDAKPETPQPSFGTPVLPAGLKLPGLGTDDKKA